MYQATFTAQLRPHTDRDVHRLVIFKFNETVTSRMHSSVQITLYDLYFLNLRSLSKTYHTLAQLLPRKLVPTLKWR